jgi:hypothetical protein
MAVKQSYEEILASAETLPPEKLSKLICTLSKVLHERYGKWAELDGVEEVRDYLEWLRFRDSHYPNGTQKTPEEFLAELRDDE